jgi:hypothetical protein
MKAKFSVIIATVVVGFYAHSIALQPDWVFSTQGMIYATPTVDRVGNVYFGNHEGRLFAVAPNGTQKWTFDGLTDWVESSAVLSHDNSLIFGCWDGYIYSLDAETGVLQWTYKTGAYIISSPALLPDGRIVVGSGDGILYCLYPDGKLSWFYVTDAEIDASPAVDEQSNIYFGSIDGKLYALRSDGSLRWSYQAQVISGRDFAWQGSVSIGSDGTLYVGNGNHHLYAFDPVGWVKWVFEAADAVDSSPAIGPDGTIYFAARDGYMYALDELGVPRWEVFVGDVFYSSPAIDQFGNVYIPGYVGGGLTQLSVINESGQWVDSYMIAEVNDSSPVLAPDGSLYLAMYDHFLYRFNAQPPAPFSWPQFRHNHRNTGRVQGPYGLPQILTLFNPEWVTADDWYYVWWWGQGWFLGKDYPWVFHRDHSWMWVHPVDIGKFWLYDGVSNLGWVYVQESSPNFYYSAAEERWYWHMPGSSVLENNRWFFDVVDQIWIQTE